MGGNLEKDLKSEENSGDLEKDWNFTQGDLEKCKKQALKTLKKT